MSVSADEREPRGSRSEIKRDGNAASGFGSLLLERDSELSVLQEALKKAQAGSGSLIVLTGAAGLGKSRLLDEVRQIARRERLALLTGAGHDREQDFAFGLALQLLEEPLSGLSSEKRKQMFAGAAGLGAPLFEGQAKLAEGEQGFSLIHGLHWLCTNLSEERPTAMCIDDLQWVDEPSLRFLGYLAQRIDELAVTLIATIDLGSVGHHAGPLEALATHRFARRLQLEPLSRAASDHQVCAGLSSSADPAFLDACWHVTKGNPSFLKELLVDVASKGIPPTREGAAEIPETAPKSVAAAVLGRLHRIGEDATSLARAAAVLGDRCELRHAAVLAGLESARAAEVAQTLAGAEIFADQQPLSFAHPIVRAAVYAEMGAGERAGAHLRAARAMYEEHAPAEVVAAHLLSAPADASAPAVEVLCEAARRALAKGAPSSAVRYLRRALAEPPPGARYPLVLLELGRAEAVAGEPNAVEHLTKAIEIIDDPVTRALASLHAGRTLYAQGRYREAADKFRGGLLGLEDRRPDFRLRLQAGYATAARLGVPREERDSDAFPPSVFESEPPGSDAARVLFAHLAFERALRGEPREHVRELAERALGHGALLSQETCDGLAYYLAGFALTVSEDLQTSELALTAALEDARARGSVLGFATASYFRASAIARRGRVNDAAADAQNALSATGYGWQLGVAGSQAILASAMIERGDLDAAERAVSTPLAQSSPTPGAFAGDASGLLMATRARVRLLRGTAEQALNDFLEAGRLQEAVDAPNPAVVPWRSGAALAAAQLGDLAEAHRLIDEELGRAGAFGAPGVIGRTLGALGTIETGAAGIEAYEAAVEVLGASEAALERARALVNLGGAVRRSKRRNAARQPLREGLDLAERCGATALAGRARQELRLAGARPRQTALSGVGALTPRERQVAGLAAQGMSNREIAEALFVTTKTVEFHLQHTFGKLEVHSRRQIGAAMMGRTHSADAPDSADPAQAPEAPSGETQA